MTKDEALKLALEVMQNQGDVSVDEWIATEKAIKEALAQTEHGWTPERIAGMARLKEVQDKKLAQPEFIKHEVKSADDWSEWVCPDPKNYLMKCCDCGLVHETQFGVVRYKSETEREDCDMVDDPNLQAVFRMRRSEEWTPEDKAHRSGGLPMAQSEQEPVAWIWEKEDGYTSIETHSLDDEDMKNVGVKSIKPLYTAPPQRTWVGLTLDERIELAQDVDWAIGAYCEYAEKIEAKLKEKNG